MALLPIMTIYHCNQLINHNDAGLGTFQQWYWMNWMLYEPGMLRV
jgi:hypothetical protein